MNVEKPLKRRMKIRREGAEGNWINFKYETLSTFCFVCGRIGHSERECNIVYASPDKVVARAYGAWLRAPTRNANMNTVSNGFETPVMVVMPGRLVVHFQGQQPPVKMEVEKIMQRDSWRLMELLAKLMVMG